MGHEFQDSNCDLGRMTITAPVMATFQIGTKLHGGVHHTTPRGDPTQIDDAWTPTASDASLLDPPPTGSSCEVQEHARLRSAMMTQLSSHRTMTNDPLSHLHLCRHRRLRSSPSLHLLSSVVPPSFISWLHDSSSFKHCLNLITLEKLELILWSPFKR
jgi:hypothetical protein